MLANIEPTSYHYDQTTQQWIETYPSIKIYAYWNQDKCLRFVREDNNYYYTITKGFIPVVYDNIQHFASKMNINTKDLHEVSIELFIKLFGENSDSSIVFEEYLPELLIRLRHIWINNQYLSDEDNDFLKWLGFNQFYPSRHIVISRNGFLPIYS